MGFTGVGANIRSALISEQDEAVEALSDVAGHSPAETTKGTAQ
jgi:hypothetical protein